MPDAVALHCSYVEKLQSNSIIAGPHTPRIFLSARSSRKPVVEHYHAEGGKDRQSHC